MTGMLSETATGSVGLKPLTLLEVSSFEGSEPMDDAYRRTNRGAVMRSRKERSLDEHLGFLPKTSERSGEEAPPAADEDGDDGAYVDAWYQVLRARVGTDTPEP